MSVLGKAGNFGGISLLAAYGLGPLLILFPGDSVCVCVYAFVCQHTLPCSVE